jgi:hypothetical protein
MGFDCWPLEVKVVSAAVRADLEPGELVGEPVAVDVFELVEGRVSGLDNDGGKRKLGQSLQLEGERSV